MPGNCPQPGPAPTGSGPPKVLATLSLPPARPVPILTGPGVPLCDLALLSLTLGAGFLFLNPPPIARGVKRCQRHGQHCQRHVRHAKPFADKHPADPRALDFFLLHLFLFALANRTGPQPRSTHEGWWGEVVLASRNVAIPVAPPKRSPGPAPSARPDADSDEGGPTRKAIASARISFRRSSSPHGRGTKIALTNVARLGCECNKHPPFASESLVRARQP